MTIVISSASAIALLALLAPLLAHADFQGAMHLMPFEEDTIGYSKTADSNAISRLQRRIDNGEAKLRFDKDFGYLPALMDELKIPRSSQMLVGSKTSFQRERISPKLPRALFFNDQIYIGFIPGSPLMEISVADPKLGGVFYTFDQVEREKPRFIRNDQCLECHASAKTMGVPGHLVRSFTTDERGIVDLGSGTSLVNHRTAMAERWGGWYVTGSSGTQVHRGNVFGEDGKQLPDHNITNLSSFFDVSQYPSGKSDIVALMVLEHQLHMHNFITRLNYSATLALKQYGHLNYLKSATEAFLKYLLFIEEAPLTDPVKGDDAFVQSFTAQGPKDSKGRSLRQFDLKTRLFKYPCSYLIYSEAFEALPAALKDKVYDRLWEILTSKDSSPEFETLSAETRQAILQILIETKSGLPDYWKAST